MNVWRGRLSRWLEPSARRFPLSPNTITVIALALNLAGAALLVTGSRYPTHFLFAIAFVILAGLADAFDGIVARAQGKESRFGDFLDHVADRVSDTILAACWLIGSNVREPIVVAAVIAVMLNGYIGTQIEATFGERSYDELGRGEFVLALVVFPIVSYITFSNQWDGVRTAGFTVAEYLALALLAFALLGIVQRVTAARRKT